MNNRAFTLVEVIMASIIFMLVMLGLLGIFAAGNMHVVHSRERMTSSELGKFFVDPLQNAVRWDTWTSGAAVNPLTVGTTPTVIKRVNERDFSYYYTISNHPSDSEIRKVVTTINWNEPTS